MNDPEVSVIVPAYNGEATIDRLLASLLPARHRSLEVLMVDDASLDKTCQAVERWLKDPRLRLVRRSVRGGPAAARNCALSLAQGRIIAFIDADMEATEHWLDELLAPVRSGRADCSGGPDQVPVDAPLLARCIGFAMDSPLATGGLRSGQTRLVRYLPGTGNLAIRREVYQTVGGFNEAFCDSGEDKEWLLRVVESGFQVTFVPAALAWHHRADSLWTHWRKMVCYGIRRVDLWRLMPRTFEWPHLAPAILVAALPAMLWWIMTGRPGWQTLAGLALFLVAAEGCLAGYRLGRFGAVLLAPIASAMVPLGYGCGILTQGWWWLQSRLTGRMPRRETGLEP